MSAKWMPENCRRLRKRAIEALKHVTPEDGVSAIALEHYKTGWHLPVISTLEDDSIPDESIPYYLLSTQIPDGKSASYNENASIKDLARYCKIPAAANMQLPLTVKVTPLVLPENYLGVGSASLLQYVPEDTNFPALPPCTLTLLAGVIDMLSVLSTSSSAFEELKTHDELLQRARHILADAIPSPPFFPYATFAVQGRDEQWHMGINAPVFQAATAKRATDGNYDLWLQPMWDMASPGQVYGDVIEHYDTKKLEDLNEHDLYILQHIGDVVCCPAETTNGNARVYLRHNCRKDSRTAEQWKAFRDSCDNKQPNTDFDLLKIALGQECAYDALWTTVYVYQRAQDGCESIYPIGARLGSSMPFKDFTPSKQEYDIIEPETSRVAAALKRSSLLPELENLHDCKHQYLQVIQHLGDAILRNCSSYYLRGKVPWDECAKKFVQPSRSRRDGQKFWTSPLHDAASWFQIENEDQIRFDTAEFSDPIASLLQVWNIEAPQKPTPQWAVFTAKFVYKCKYVPLTVVERLLHDSWSFEEATVCRALIVNKKAGLEDYLGPWTVISALADLKRQDPKIGIDLKNLNAGRIELSFTKLLEWKTTEAACQPCLGEDFKAMVSRNLTDRDLTTALRALRSASDQFTIVPDSDEPHLVSGLVFHFAVKDNP